MLELKHGDVISAVDQQRIFLRTDVVFIQQHRQHRTIEHHPRVVLFFPVVETERVTCINRTPDTKELKPRYEKQKQVCGEGCGMMASSPSSIGAHLERGLVKHVHLVRLLGEEPVHHHRLGLPDAVGSRLGLASP